MSSAIGDCDHIVARDLRDVDDLEDAGGDLLDTCRQLLAIGTLDLDLREHRGRREINSLLGRIQFIEHK